MIEWLKSWWSGTNSGWRIFSPYSRWDVKRNAVVDAKLERPVPDPDDEVEPWYLGAMKEHFENIVRGIGSQLQDKDTPLSMKEKSLTTRKEASDRDLTEMQDAYAKARGQFEGNNPGLLAETQARKGLTYLSFSAILFVFEFPMNFAAFQIFGESASALTWLTTFLVAGILLGSAHFMGIEWRKGPFKNKQNLSVFLVTLVMPILAVASVAALRAVHFSHLADSEVGKVSPSLLFVSFAVFNLGIYLVAALLSRWAHPEGGEQVIECRKQFRSTRKLVDRITLELDSVKKDRQLLKEKYQTEWHRVTDQYFELTKLYLMENVRVRNGQGVNGAKAQVGFLKDVNLSTLLTEPPMFRGKYGQQCDTVEKPQSKTTGETGQMEGAV